MIANEIGWWLAGTQFALMGPAERQPRRSAVILCENVVQRDVGIGHRCPHPGEEVAQRGRINDTVGEPVQRDIGAVGSDVALPIVLVPGVDGGANRSA